MSEFFQPFRRKVGVVTLLMACVVLVAWIRSRNNVESLQFKCAGLQPMVISGNQKVWFTFQRRPIVLTWASFTTPRREIDFGDSVYVMTIDNARECEQVVRWNPIGTGHFYQEPFVPSDSSVVLGDSNAQTRLVAIPYWSIVLPLTLFSAWLLLSKQRLTPSKVAK